MQYKAANESGAVDRLLQHSMTRAAIAGALGSSDRKWVDHASAAAGIMPPSWGDADPFDGSDADDLDDEGQEELKRIEADALRQTAERKKRRRRRNG